MRKTSIIDRKLFKLFDELIDACIGFCPDDFEAIQVFVEVGAVGDNQRELLFHLSCPSRPNYANTEADDRIKRAGQDLVDYFTKSGAAFPGFRIVLQRQANDHWKNDIKRLDTEAASAIVSPISGSRLSPK